MASKVFTLEVETVNTPKCTIAVAKKIDGIYNMIWAAHVINAPHQTITTAFGFKDSYTLRITENAGAPHSSTNPVIGKSDVSLQTGYIVDADNKISKSTSVPVPSHSSAIRVKNESQKTIFLSLRGSIGWNSQGATDDNIWVGTTHGNNITVDIEASDTVAIWLGSESLVADSRAITGVGGNPVIVAFPNETSTRKVRFAWDGTITNKVPNGAWVVV